MTFFLSIFLAELGQNLQPLLNDATVLMGDCGHFTYEAATVAIDRSAAMPDAGRLTSIPSFSKTAT